MSTSSEHKKQKKGHLFDKRLETFWILDFPTQTIINPKFNTGFVDTCFNFWRGQFWYSKRNIPVQSLPLIRLEILPAGRSNLTSKWNGSFQCDSEFDDVSRMCNIRYLILLISAQVNHEHHPKRTALRPPHLTNY